MGTLSHTRRVVIFVPVESSSTTLHTSFAASADFCPPGSDGFVAHAESTANIENTTTVFRTFSSNRSTQTSIIESRLPEASDLRPTAWERGPTAWLAERSERGKLNLATLEP